MATKDTAAASQEAIRQLTSTLQTRAMLAESLGQGFAGKRSLYKTFGYPERVTQEELWTLFSRQNIARRIVVAPAAGTWVRPPKLVATSSRLQTAWDKLVGNKSINVWYQLARLDVLAGIGEYSILFCSNGDSTPSKPIASSRRRRKEILFLAPYSQITARITKYDDDVSSKNFGRPELYGLIPGNAYQRRSAEGSFGTGALPLGGEERRGSGGILPAGTGISTENTIHYSRVVHVAEEAYDNDVFGAPRLRPVYNDLLDLLKIIGGAAETFWLAGNRGLHINVDKELELNMQDASQLASEVEDYVHDLSRVINTRGVDVQSLGSDVPDPSNAFSAIISLICGATTIPRRILMGSEAGHLASEQDRANWADRLRERISLFVEPVILFPFVLRLQEMGALPAGDFEIDWPDPFSLSPLERSQSFSNFSRGLASATKPYESGAIFITREELREQAGLKTEPDPGMGTLPDVPEDIFTSEDNIIGRRNTGMPDNNADDKDDSENPGSDPQQQRS